MAFFRTCQALFLGVFLLASPAFAAHIHHSSTSARHHRSYRHYRHHRVSHHHYIRGQRGIEPQRALEIQNALIHVHYLSGPASGRWDSSTEAAMRKYQADHGWQTKLIPDSRAIISLGLGPKDDHMVASAADSTPQPAASEPSTDSLASADSAQSDSDEVDTLADVHTLRN